MSQLLITPSLLTGTGMVREMVLSAEQMPEEPEEAVKLARAVPRKILAKHNLISLRKQDRRQEPMTEQYMRISDKISGMISTLRRSRGTERTLIPSRPGRSKRMTLPMLGGIAAASLAGSMLLAGCQTISGSTAVSLLRIIDASYNAPSLNLYVEGTLLAGNLGQGSITRYANLAPTNNAVVKVTATTSTTALVSSNTSLLAGTSQSALISDINAVYQVTVLEDQSTPAPSGHSEFRLLNQAPSTGPVDVYFLAGTSNTVFATAKPVITGLAVGATSGYVTIPSSTLYMVIAPTGTTLADNVSTIYTSAAFPLVGGEVRTVLIVDPLLVTEPVQVYIADDVD